MTGTVAQEAQVEEKRGGWFVCNGTGARAVMGGFFGAGWFLIGGSTSKVM